MGWSEQDVWNTRARRAARPESIVAGERFDDDPNWQELDCDGHGGAVRVVVRMSDDEHDYPYGQALVKLLMAAPGLRDALETIVASDGNFYDLKQIAKDALDAIA